MLEKKGRSYYEAGLIF